ncbi:hypothetical protein C5B42_03965 [Candidatus Cerribacteria bacterium 'Amazon FNV 2010 28 9']|uniref:Uncharacterized protein n=1 Tax=Candidatus Cerribacteria bacterium 'Amazon FNV 2010 28 9' TaxID=2081795 RepID=A0A317JPC7_9BACT|nr:MAG: hypothetical protein C5B42_03965 [Candidatus Cerribacteria bacterium 'Amazon FNV 2010 28 9']
MTEHLTPHKKSTPEGTTPLEAYELARQMSFDAAASKHVRKAVRAELRESGNDLNPSKPQDGESGEVVEQWGE